MTIATYDVNNHILVVDGQRIHEAGTDKLVTIEYTTDRFSLTVGVGGSVVRNKINNLTGMATLSLLYGSLGLAILDGFRRKDDENGGGVFSFSITDIGSGTEVVSADAWVEAFGSIEHAGEEPNIEVKVRLKSMSLDMGIYPGLS